MNMKKTIILTAVIMLISAASVWAQTTLEIVVKDIKELKGSIRVGLFDNDEDFLKKAVVGKVVKAAAAEVTIVIENLKPGSYGVSVIHDENENNELDSNFMGIPKEGFAFGNNATGTFGPPSFDKTIIKIEDKPVRQEIKLKYL